ncbi:hypothetical protein GOP47_0027102 [Adiantum capillus-veneris]|nr:hypothetical protein GOP47_0027102 [Adiantum capillus-veneris]
MVSKDQNPADGRCNDLVFFDDLLSEAGDVPPMSPRADACISSEVNFDDLEKMLNEDKPLAQMNGSLIVHDVNADTSNVYKDFLCLFVGIYALDSLLEAQVATTYSHKDSTHMMECS